MTNGIRRTSKIVSVLPARIARTVGQIITKWSYIDYRLSMAVWKLVGVSDDIGRVAVSDPRAHDKLEIIRVLLHLKGKDLNEREYKKFHKGLQDLVEVRDMLAHGIWVSHDGEIKLIKFKGNLTDQSIPKLGRKRRLKPESLRITPEGLSVILQSLENAIHAVGQLNELASSLQTRRTRSPRKSPQKKPKNRS